MSEGDLLQSIESVSHVRESWKLKKYFILFMRLLKPKEWTKAAFHENIKFLKDDLIDQPWIPPFCQSHSKFCRVVGKQFSMANKKWGGEGGRGLKFFVWSKGSSFFPFLLKRWARRLVFLYWWLSKIIDEIACRWVNLCCYWLSWLSLGHDNGSPITTDVFSHPARAIEKPYGRVIFLSLLIQYGQHNGRGISKSIDRSMKPFARLQITLACSCKRE